MRQNISDIQRFLEEPRDSELRSDYSDKKFGRWFTSITVKTERILGAVWKSPWIKIGSLCKNKAAKWEIDAFW